MKTVGKREFHDQQARYLRAVEHGETLEITDRGRVVARVVPTKGRKRSTVKSQPAPRRKPYKARPLPAGSLPAGFWDYFEADREHERKKR